MRFRIAVHGAPEQAVSWFVSRGHVIVNVGADLILCGSDVPLDVGQALVVAMLDEGNLPNARADIVLRDPVTTTDFRRIERLLERLHSSATTIARPEAVQQALDRAMEAVTSRSPHLPSVYFLQGDRLRCVASRRYYQILDGFPTDVSVLGSVVTSGAPVIVNHRDEVEVFATAQPGVASEVCLPLRTGEEVVGAFSVESERPFTAEEVACIQKIGSTLQHDIQAAGGIPPLTHDAELGVSVTDMIRAEDRLEVYRVVLAGLQRLSGMSTAMIVRRDASGTPFIADATGPLADDIRRVSSDSLEEMNRWVEHNSSCFTVAPGYGEGWLTSPAFQASDARSVSVHRMASVADGYLLCADEEVVGIVPDQVQRLEVLAVTASGVFSTVDNIESLEQMAWQDPLTGLGHRGLFEAELGKALKAPRLNPLALLMIDVDRFKRVNDHLGHQAGDDMLRSIADTLQGVLRPDDDVYRIGGDEFAAVAEVRDPGTALGLAERMCAAVKGTGGSVSIGVATVGPAVKPPSETLVSLADNALYAAKRSGRERACLSPERVKGDTDPPPD